MKMTLVTGNKHKLEEWRHLLPKNISLEFVDIALDEIQSMDLAEIVTDKAKRAYAKLGKPVVVEDIATAIDSMNGLPGPFIKFFVKQMGNDCLVRLAGKENSPATVTCTVAYYDGVSVVVATGEVKGTVVTPRGKNGFGFDFGFIPAGADRTYAEMTPEEKGKVSHRSKAIIALIPLLEQLNL